MPRPSWSHLHAIAAFAIVVEGGLHACVLPSALRLGFGLAVIAVTFVAMQFWARANRAALDMAAWCACASATVSVRVIVSSDDAAPDRETVVEETMASRAVHSRA